VLFLKQLKNLIKNIKKILEDKKKELKREKNKQAWVNLLDMDQSLKLAIY
jgi:hypothetical protein